MKIIALLFSSAAIALAGDAGDIRAFMWHEGRTKPGGFLYDFFLAPERAKEIMEAEALGAARKGDDQSGRTWSRGLCFSVRLIDKAPSYSKDKISIIRVDDGKWIHVVSGTIEVDHAKRVVKIRLDINADGEVIPFPVNGTYAVSALEGMKKPNKAPEPTPGSVTPRASDPKAK